MFISHDLSVVEHLCDRVGVMYLGSMVEMAGKKQLFSNPMHPYTRALMSAIPIPDPTLKRERIVLQGDIPSPANPPSGCKFHTRCPIASDICKKHTPEFIDKGNKHFVACHFA
ncbi:putative D,D-dipeptide transport ATP-binding protein DdpF [compost metagenome]